MGMMSTNNVKRSFFRGRIIVNKNTNPQDVINSLKNEIEKIQIKYNQINDLDNAKKFYQDIVKKLREYTTLNPCPNNRQKITDIDCEKEKVEYYQLFKGQITLELINKNVSQQVITEINNLLINASRKNGNLKNIM